MKPDDTLSPRARAVKALPLAYTRERIAFMEANLKLGSVVSIINLWKQEDIDCGMVIHILEPGVEPLEASHYDALYKFAYGKAPKHPKRVSIYRRIWIRRSNGVVRMYTLDSSHAAA